MTAPDRVTLYRRIMSDKWHLAEVGETMSHANAEYAEYIRADLARTPLAEALVEAASPLMSMAMWTETAEDTEMVIVSVGTVRRIRAALRAIGEKS